MRLCVVYAIRACFFDVVLHVCDRVSKDAIKTTKNKQTLEKAKSSWVERSVYLFITITIIIIIIIVIMYYYYLFIFYVAYSMPDKSEQA